MCERCTAGDLVTRTRQSRAASTSPAKRTLLRLAIAAGLTGGSATARTTIEVRPLAGRLAAALVLGTAREGGPGPLVSHFTGAGAGKLPCPVFIVPGSLSEADIDRLS